MILTARKKKCNWNCLYSSIKYEQQIKLHPTNWQYPLFKKLPCCFLLCWRFLLCSSKAGLLGPNVLVSWRCRPGAGTKLEENSILVNVKTVISFAKGMKKVQCWGTNWQKQAFPGYSTSRRSVLMHNTVNGSMSSPYHCCRRVFQ